MLGRAVLGELRGRRVKFWATGREVNIGSEAQLAASAAGMIGSEPCHWIINCAAYTAVDDAEQHQDKVYRVNSQGVQNLASTAASLGAGIVHFSTDYVFDGKGDRPYSESDAPRPISVYGASKLEGESRLQNTWERYFILRTSWLYAPFGRNFLRTMVRLFHNVDLVRVVSDQVGAPTYAPDLARVAVALTEADDPQYGVYHAANSGRTSWYEFAARILEEVRARELPVGEVRLVPITSEEYGQAATRPKNSTLATTKLADVFGIRMRPWMDALRSCMDSLSMDWEADSAKRWT